MEGIKVIFLRESVVFHMEWLHLHTLLSEGGRQSSKRVTRIKKQINVPEAASAQRKRL